MKTIKLLLAGLAMTMTLQAQTATEIFNTKCVACHMLKPMMDKTKMKAMSQEDRMAMKEKMMKNMKAPPMSKVSAKIKFDLKDDKTAFVAFVKDYIVNPSADKSHCMPMALKMFGTMPAIGKSMSEEEINTISNWLYDNFSNKWDMHDEGMMCKMKNKDSKGMKCGASHQEKNAGKCAGDKISPKKTPKTMKCGQGKCGGK